eukprot:327639_1
MKRMMLILRRKSYSWLFLIICCGFDVQLHRSILCHCVFKIINFASFVMEISSSPGWRPSFAYFNRWTGLFGAISCLSVMFLLDWVYALLTTSIAFGLYLFISWKDPGVSWGGVFDSVAIFNAYKSVLNLALNNKTVDTDSINWRLIHFRQDASNDPITRFVETLQKGKSLIFAVEITCGEYRTNLMQSVKQNVKMSNTRIRESIGTNPIRMHPGYLPIRKHISSRMHFIGKRVHGFCNQIVSSSYRSGVQSALQMCGLGVLLRPMKQEQMDDDEEYVEILRDLINDCMLLLKYNLLSLCTCYAND